VGDGVIIIREECLMALVVVRSTWRDAEAHTVGVADVLPRPKSQSTDKKKAIVNRIENNGLMTDLVLGKPGLGSGRAQGLVRHLQMSIEEMHADTYMPV
jgi:hypothetical protein